MRARARWRGRAREFPQLGTRKPAHADFVLRRGMLAGSSAKRVAGAALSQGAMRISWQAHCFRKVMVQMFWQAREGVALLQGELADIQ